MSPKTVLFLLTVFVIARADLISITAKGTISSVVEFPQIQTGIAVSPSGETAGSSVIPRKGDPFSIDLLIDTDRQGVVSLSGNSSNPATSAMASGIEHTTSYLPVSISTSGFPSIQALHLNSDNDITIQNVRETISTDPSGSNYTMIDQVLGTISSVESEVTLRDYYFLSMFINSDLESLVENQKATIIEGFINERLIDEIPVTFVTYLESSDARLVSVNRTRQVPEPSTLVLLMAGAVLLPAIRFFEGRYRHRNL